MHETSRPIRRLVFVLACILGSLILRPERSQAAPVLILTSATGETSYLPIFTAQVEAWRATAQSGGHTVQTFGLAPAATNAAQDFLQALSQFPENSPDPIWIVLLGHGTDDGRTAKVNLPGTDLEASQLAQALQRFAGTVAIIDATSASGGFLPKLAATNRIVITATRAGAEQNYARFGEHLAQALTDPKADLDQDGQTSLLELFLHAALATEAAYKESGLMLTEHALISDNGATVGTPASAFTGVRPIPSKTNPSLTASGFRSHQLALKWSAELSALTPAQRKERDTLELQIESLRQQKAVLAKEDYYRQLEALLVQLAKLNTNR